MLKAGNLALQVWVHSPPTQWLRLLANYYFVQLNVFKFHDTIRIYWHKVCKIILDIEIDEATNS